VSEKGIALRGERYYFLGVKKTISLKLSAELLARLEEESVERDMTKSAVVRECLEQSFDTVRIGEKPSCYDLSRDLEGSIKGLPKDIATNPKYMEGFGE
jgi:hypothetical protein